jgi:PTH1 family peptidyl-tRNA hydrolase
MARLAENDFKMVAGLGNPGDRYQNTRHNAGFMALALFAVKLGQENVKVSGSNLLAKGRVGNQKVLLVWPQNYMNNSGPAVREVLDYYKVSPENLLVVHDEMDLPLGRVKLCRGRGSAGHKGLESLFECLKTDFDRLRFGVGRPVKTAFEPGVIDYVLSPFTSLETELVDKTLKKAADLIEVWVAQNLAAAQRLGNRTEKEKTPKAKAPVATDPTSTNPTPTTAAPNDPALAPKVPS